MLKAKKIKEFEALKFFKASEFDSPDVKNSGLLMDINFVRGLDLARLQAGVPFVINSGYRTVNHNKKVGGKRDSSHLKGLAVDIKAVTSRERFLIIRALLMVGFTRIGIGKGFIHVDLDEKKQQNLLWHYYKS